MSSERIEQFYRDATVSDLVKVMESETVEARFADDCSNWVFSKLRGWGSSSRVLDNWIDDDGKRWDHCQVYDPPQWFLDKPDPGEGYRLLGKFPDEPVQGGDFIRSESGDWIELRDGCNPVQQEGVWYRRRIEPPKPEPKFAVGQQVKIIGPPIKGEGPIFNWCVEMDKYIGAVEFVRSQPRPTPEGVFYQVSNIANWSFREDYLEAVVEPEPKHYSLQVGDTADTGNGFRLTITEHGVEVT